MNKRYKSSKGITLISLVITIIVLLILAGVSIATLTGQDGILSKAQNAVDQTNQKDLKEQVDLAILGTTMQKDYQYNKDNAKTEIGKITGVTVTDNGDGTLTVTKDGITVNVDVNGNTTIEENTIADPTNPPATGTNPTEVKNKATEYYGALVENYGVTYDATAGATNGWRIFYADGEDVPENERHIYLIADDYIHYDYAPRTTNYTIYKNSNYCLSMDNVYQDYTGSASINSDIGSKWLSKYLNYSTNASSTNINIRAVAYILDTSIWNATYKNDYADYAIGSPTLEMFCKSYKDTHPTKYVECEAEASTNGYNVKWSDTSTYSMYINGCTQDDFNSVYIKSNTSKAYAMWLASPSANAPNCVLSASYYGNVYNSSYNRYGTGFRPLVSLKSNIQLEKQENGNYKIK